MKKIVSLNFITILFLGVLSGSAISMDDDLPQGVQPPRPQKLVRERAQQKPSLSIRRLAFNAKTDSIMRNNPLVAGRATRQDVKKNPKLAMADFYTLDLLKNNVRSHEKFGKAGALLDSAAKAYQSKNREALRRIVQCDTSSIINQPYRDLFQNALLDLAGAPPMRPRIDTGCGGTELQGNGKTSKPVTLVAPSAPPQKKNSGCCS